MKNIYSIIYNVYKECEIASFPFECEKVITHYGYKLYKYSDLKNINNELFEMCKMYSNDAFLFKDKRLIAYNDEMPYFRIRFSLMHELGHILLKHKSSLPMNEDEADYFASCILAPRIMIHYLMQSNKYSTITADDIHEYFGISISAANNALSDYHKWFENISHTTRKPSEIEILIKNLLIEKKEINTIDKKKINKKKTAERYLLDQSNNEYFISMMENRRTKPY